MKIVRLARVDSTSTYMRQTMGDAASGSVVVTDCQEAGRGQRGNHWESQPGKNLTFSIMLRPRGVEASRQYAVSEAVAVAVVDTLSPLVPEAEELTIKWPNDIYYGDFKICGILIENSIRGTGILKSIAGIGININQREFTSDAPNPVSLYQITGREHALGPILERLAAAIERNVENIGDERGGAEIGLRYRSLLWRRDGMYPYRLPDGTEFTASIESVAPDGMLTLRHSDNTLSTHAFKEVAAIL